MDTRSYGAFRELSEKFSGELFYGDATTDRVVKMAYSTDASVYQERPLAVAIPRSVEDIKSLVAFAGRERVTLIPRAAGTSLAGQVVGNGIVVDISRYFTRIKEVNKAERWVTLQPGVIRDDLNRYLKDYGLLFGPETSTANRAMIGGMVGNNSCGLHSIVWGAVRDHLLEVTGILSDGSEVTFKKENISDEHYSGLKKKIYSELFTLLSDKTNQHLIENNFPKKSVVRRNTGYALDSLLSMRPFTENGEPFNLCKLIAGSEGTLVFITEVKLRLIDLPPEKIALVCVHCDSVDEALRSNLVALRHKPMSSELVDRHILNFTLNHPEYHRNRFFIEGDPAAILLVEFMADDETTVREKADCLQQELIKEGYGYAWPVLYNAESKYAWDIRKAGLGLLRNLPGDVQPVNLIEDCAVAPEDLPAYIQELQDLLDRHQVSASFYAHAGAGELHVEPMLNLKTQKGLALFREILAETVGLVKKYNGSLSGEHGDGRLRGEYIASVAGGETYALFKKVKAIFDSQHVFNQGKITGAPAMDTHLRILAGQKGEPLKTTFDFSKQGDLRELAQKCSGSGDCRKSAAAGGTMCPSYMASGNEIDTTRARANVLRQFLDNPSDNDPLNHVEIKAVMDRCLSCKGCKTECPSGVDVTKMKAEFLQHYYDRNGIPFRAKLIGNFVAQMKLAMVFPRLYNFVFGNKALRRIANRLVGFHPERSIPLLEPRTLLQWHRGRKGVPQGKSRAVHLFCDEFTNFYDMKIGQKAILLLETLGYEVVIPAHLESGRTYLSKGLVKKAAVIANRNIGLLSEIVTEERPIVGIEPSAILTLRDEYIDLAEQRNKQKAVSLAANAFTIEEFLAAEAGKGHISKELFTREKKTVVVHGHCYQKALSSQHHSNIALSLPENYQVQFIASGCCGMAGAFGYEKEHFHLSQEIGELILFPTVRSLPPQVLIAASGTSCRHQIKDGTGKKVFHPVEILWNALSV